MTDHEIISKERPCPQLQAVRIVRAAALVMAGLLLMLAILAVWRRSIGAFQTPLPLDTLLGVGLILISPALVLRLWWRSAAVSQEVSSVEKAWTLCLPSISLMAILAAISVPGTSTPGMILVGSLFLVGEAIVYRFRKRFAFRGNWFSAKRSADVKAKPKPLEETPISSQDIEAVHDASELPAANVSQKLTRYHTEEGVDCLKGWLRVDIPAGHRAQNVHLAFCPAFEQSPRIVVQPEEGSVSCRIKTVQSLPYGAHLEVKLPKPSSADQTLALRFNALAREHEP